METGSSGTTGQNQQNQQDQQDQQDKRSQDSSANLREIEWRLEVSEAGKLEAIESWLEDQYDEQPEHSEQSGRSVTGLTVGSGVTKNLTDTYYDTEDWVLYRAGYTLCISQRGKSSEAIMEAASSASSSSGSAVGVRHQKLSESLQIGEISSLRKSGGEVGERLRTLAGNKKLQQLFEIRTRRRDFDVHLGDAGDSGDQEEAQAEICLDDSEILLGRGEEPAKLRRVEVEVAPGAVSKDLRHFIEEMRSSSGVSPTSISKYEAGLYATGLVPYDTSELGSTRVDASMSTGEVAYAVMRKQLAAIQEHESGVRLGEDSEAVHDMRVATRRLRTAIKLFSEVLPGRALWLEGELRWLAGVLGEVRDLDVQIQELRVWAEGGESRDTGSTQALGDLIEAVEKQRSAARGRMLEALDSGRYERLIASLGSMVRRSPPGGKGSRAEARITRVAPSLLSRRYKKFRRAAKRAEASDAAVEDYHELRKKGKSLRYALEFHRDIYGSPVKDLIRPLKSLQDDLGRHQDATVSARHLQELSGSGDQGLSNATVFAMGAYAERHRREAAELRAEVPKSKAFRTLRSRGTQKELEKKLDKKR